MGEKLHETQVAEGIVISHHSGSVIIAPLTNCNHFNNFCLITKLYEWHLQTFPWSNSKKILNDCSVYSGQTRFIFQSTVNTHNCRIWSKENKHAYTEESLHAPHVKVWCGFENYCGPLFSLNSLVQNLVGGQVQSMENIT